MGRGVFAGFMILTVLVGVVSHNSQAADIDGAWLTDATLCRQVFEKKGRQLSFAKGLRTFENGFLIEGNQIRERIARCTLQTRREEGSVVNLIAVCSTNIAIDTIQFRLRSEGHNKLVREFAGIPDMEIAYERCVM